MSKDFKAQWRLAYYLCRASRHIYAHEHTDGVLLWYLRLRRYKNINLIPHGDSETSFRLRVREPFFKRYSLDLGIVMPTAMRMMVDQQLKVGKFPWWAEPWRSWPWSCK